MCSFLHIHTSQGSPKASFSWCFLFNTSTHHRVHQKRVPADVSFSTQPHITGFTKYVFQLVCPFQHIHILQGLPKAFSSWCVIFNTSTHHWVHQRRVPAVCPFPHNHGTYHRVYQRRVPAGVSFSTHSHITGFTKGVFQLVCPFQHNHTSLGSSKACSSWCVIFNTSTHHRLHQKRVPAGVSFSTQPHITGFIKACSSWCVIFNTSTHHRVHQKHVPAGVSFFTHPHITGCTKGVFQLVCHFITSVITGITKGMFFSLYPHSLQGSFLSLSAFTLERRHRVQKKRTFLLRPYFYFQVSPLKHPISTNPRFRNKYMSYSEAIQESEDLQKWF